MITRNTRSVSTTDTIGSAFPCTEEGNPDPPRRTGAQLPLEGVIRLIEAWHVVFQHAEQRGHELSDGSPARSLDPELLRQGYHRIVHAVEQFGEATHRAQAGETAN